MLGTKTKENPIEEKIALIDADSLLYFSSYGSEEDTFLSETKLSEKIFDILNIVSTSYNITKYHIFVKGKENFRYKIFPEYKKNRPVKHPVIDALVKYTINTFKAIESDGAESDDYLYTYSQLPEYKGKCIICTVDKDMYQIPGLHYDYQKNRFHEISEDEAVYNLAIQMLMGDACDGIKGLKGVGKVKAQKLIKLGMSPMHCLRVIYREYLKRCDGNANEEIRLNYALLKLKNMNND